MIFFDVQTWFRSLSEAILAQTQPPSHSAFFSGCYSCESSQYCTGAKPEIIAEPAFPEHWGAWIVDIGGRGGFFNDADDHYGECRNHQYFERYEMAVRQRQRPHGDCVRR